jgi:hypothetical protein
LLLHQHIAEERLPRWLDEGLAQWTSGGITELLSNPNPSLLDRAVITQNWISFERLAERFPQNQQALMLAYQQSYSLVGFMINHYGQDAIFALLAALKNGEPIDDALWRVYGLTLADLEQAWIDHMQGETPWLSYLAIHIYEILFLLAALLTVVGFFRVMMRRKRQAALLDDDE